MNAREMTLLALETILGHMVAQGISVARHTVTGNPDGTFTAALFSVMANDGTKIRTYSIQIKQTEEV